MHLRTALTYSWPRAAGIAFGIGTQLFLGVTVCFLFCFLRDGSTNAHPAWLSIDIWLALQFAIAHSFILLPRVRAAISRVIPRQFYGSIFCLFTCIGLWLTFSYWRASSGIVWQARGWVELAVRLSFYGSWIALLLSLRVTGFGYQT